MPLRHIWRDVRSFMRMMWRMGIKNRAVRRHWWRTMLDCAFHNPRAFRYVGAMVALYLHLGPFAQFVSRQLTVQIDAIESTTWAPPAAIDVTTAAQAS
jgi:hypothetical protein